MSKTLRIVADFTYEPTIMYDDQESMKWFYEEILTKELIIHENENIGDDIGTMKIISLSPKTT